MVGDFFLTIDDEKMKACPICAGSKISKPQNKRKTEKTPECLAYTCGGCGYTQYVHTEDSKFLKGFNIKPGLK